jgi:hypothetical protein
MPSEPRAGDWGPGPAPFPGFNAKGGALVPHRTGTAFIQTSFAAAPAETVTWLMGLEQLASE